MREIKSYLSISYHLSIYRLFIWNFNLKCYVDFLHFIQKCVTSCFCCHFLSKKDTFGRCIFFISVCPSVPTFGEGSDNSYGHTSKYFMNYNKCIVLYLQTCPINLNISLICCDFHDSNGIMFILL